ncbi:hypothetical protein AMTR_s00062p00020240 [Amborella trichopoda]|uniref:Uncharacterized protein n=1 Tax=Amborella trichopoda TaxID=13333 RepID=U5DBA7_AMBTC|nr:hypothetical protein AMTR_s00062p00020240 [Amborella trichopoda]
MRVGCSDRIQYSILDHVQDLNFAPPISKEIDNVQVLVTADLENISSFDPMRSIHESLDGSNNMATMGNSKPPTFGALDESALDPMAQSRENIEAHEKVEAREEPMVQACEKVGVEACEELEALENVEARQEPIIKSCEKGWRD